MDLRDIIFKRTGHVAVPYRNKMLVWGGYVETDVSMPHGHHCEYHNPDELWVYNTLTEVWSRALTSGDIPPKSSGSCGVLHDYHLYIFGGYQKPCNGMPMGNTNNLFRLDLRTRVWQQLAPSGQPPSPCDKLVGWEYREKIYLFGGFGPSPVDTFNFKFVLDVGTINSEWPGRGWNNQFVCYDIARNCWEWPTTHGPRPLPRAAHAADISGHIVYVFGGRMGSVRNDELHSLNMETMTWSGNLKTAAVDGSWPVGRSWHSLTFINPNTAILYGGLAQRNIVLSDCWQMTVGPYGSVTWKQHSTNMTDTQLPLLWHKAVYFGSVNEIYIVGGFKKTNLDTPISGKDHSDSLLILSFSPKSLLRICLDFVIDNEIIILLDMESSLQISELLPKTLREILQDRLLMKNNVYNTVK